ncbi:hypothetical protein [Mobilicoccus pelagius]|nr:hypothetical protein [Mobilicoccus pelagius]
MDEVHVPPGWPVEVPPPGDDDFVESAVGWLLDLCPADYRGYDVWRRHPRALAWIAVQHVEGQVAVMREAYRRARVDLGERVPPEALREVLGTLEREGLRLRAAVRAASLVRDALDGQRFTPRL